MMLTIKRVQHIILLLCMTDYITETCCICTEDTIRGEQEFQHYVPAYGWRNDYHVTEKTISCRNISIDFLKLYEETDERDPISYPLTLEVTNSNISLLPSQCFKNLRNITILILENIKLNMIMPSAFHFLDRLNEIRLGQNELTIISEGIFNSLLGLRRLDLSRNRIEKISDHAFVGISLSYLNISNNNISTLTKTVSNSFTQLSVLDISHNSFSDINSVYGLTADSLYISHNHLKMLDFETFNNVPELIDVSFNNITEITNLNLSKASRLILTHNEIKSFEKNNHATVLDLSHNNLETLGSDMLGHSLVEFRASFNSINSITRDAFFGLYDLTYLYLDNNNISSIPNSCFKDLTSLTYLNLSKNSLDQFQYGTFDSLLNLNVLDISSNDFKVMPQYMFHGLGGLTDLFFQNNEISDIDIIDLKGYQPNLRKIDLNNNIWSCRKLVDIVQNLKNRRISFSYGNSWEQNNIHGIKCYDTYDNRFENKNNTEVSLENPNLNSFFNEDFTKLLCTNISTKILNRANFSII